jgi:hypothetical protein
LGEVFQDLAGDVDGGVSALAGFAECPVARVVGSGVMLSFVVRCPLS